MDLNKALSLVKPKLKEERYEHTKRVVTTALSLAGKYKVDEHKVMLAAAFHDYAKNMPKEELRSYIELDECLPQRLLSFHHELWHGPVGAQLVKRDIGITDEEVLTAIRFHTTGRAQMNDVEKVVFLADYIEPGRKFPGIDEARETADRDLNRGCLYALKNTITFLISKGQPIYPDTFHAYNDLLKTTNK
ncbi:bis(5'-nucleosyl)-tetraphosphatase (symmetrical) YqeK [Salirhabdus salicampi]|uniref:bis(5'-nucleosyl)-tetraphosphatase (symmetrical) YqeK n=1 Tax=Salirhabdus salicampi TaxID=476102 RepID=UPI0020C53487|nr:bis(5'-nucleosyl)-tetraphosphatase (symmetrical) YqeK [Salirhabdus salicampi]MCP8616931.1 bis(5'-nucleosyl)-tetraphosphatase (symmetrical) YqeK [Salirhabdus salicampi]